MTERWVDITRIEEAGFQRRLHVETGREEVRQVTPGGFCGEWRRATPEERVTAPHKNEEAGNG